MMPAPAPSRTDNIEIPDRPSVASHAENPQPGRKRVLLYGGIAAAALLIVIALFQPGSEEGPRVPGDAPLIKAGEQPIKVSPELPAAWKCQIATFWSTSACTARRPRKVP